METARFKKRLLDKERELLSVIQHFESEARAGGEAEVRDPIDAATVAQGTDESLHEEARASQTLVQVRDALRRIEDGSFGRCIACDRQIEPARLEAIPWSQYCLKDQEQRDREAGVRRGSTL